MPSSTDLSPRQRGGLVVAIIACLLSQVIAARATVGGPETATILGWDPADRKIYYIVYFSDESDRMPRVYFLDLKSSPPGKVVPLNLWPERPTDYKALYSKVEALKKRLVQLSASVPDALTLTVKTTSFQKDWRDVQGDLREKYTLEIQVSRESLVGQTQVTSYCNREVLIKEWYEIPELPFAVVSLSYTGQPVETCYALPAILLLKAGAPSKN